MDFALLKNKIVPHLDDIMPIICTTKAWVARRSINGPTLIVHDIPETVTCYYSYRSYLSLGGVPLIPGSGSLPIDVALVLHLESETNRPDR